MLHARVSVLELARVDHVGGLLQVPQLYICMCVYVYIDIYIHIYAYIYI